MCYNRIGDNMEQGKSRKTNIILNFLNSDTKSEMEKFVQKNTSQNFIEIKNLQDLNTILSENINTFINNLSDEELITLRSYTGYNFKNINAILRGNWTYEENGKLTEEIQNKFLDISKKISTIIQKFPNIPFNFTTFRGTEISSFHEYGIYSIKELMALKNNYMYESGFTSTSIIEASCYFKKNLETEKNYNVKIKYLITPEYNEGALLTSYYTSYSPTQNEYILSSGCLSKIIDVKINEELDEAVLTAIVIPKKIYDFEKSKENKTK